MHTRASTSELVEPLEEPERTLNHRLCRRNRRVPFERRDERPKIPKEICHPILDITHFRNFLNFLEFHDPMANADNEPMRAADRVVAPTPGPKITIPANTSMNFSVYVMISNTKRQKNEAVRLMIFALSLTGEAKTWLDELNEGTIESSNELQTAFISRFFPQLYSIDFSEKSEDFLNTNMKL
ncbi:hypothetical protein Tco_1474708 [Tanacetum coccineum]